MSFHPAANLPHHPKVWETSRLGRGAARSLLVSWLILPLLAQHQLSLRSAKPGMDRHQALPSSSLPFRRW